MFAGRVKIVSHSFCRASAILKYFCPLYREVFAHFCIWKGPISGPKSGLGKALLYFLSVCLQPHKKFWEMGGGDAKPDQNQGMFQNSLWNRPRDDGWSGTASSAQGGRLSSVSKLGQMKK